jgi:hypothetical protein
VHRDGRGSAQRHDQHPDDISFDVLHCNGGQLVERDRVTERNGDQTEQPSEVGAATGRDAVAVGVPNLVRPMG